MELLLALVGAVAPGQPAQGCDRAAGQKEAGGQAGGQAAALGSSKPHTEPVPAHPLGSIRSFSWGSAVQAALAQLSPPSAELTPGWGEVQPPWDHPVGFKVGIEVIGRSGDVRNLVTLFSPFLFPLEAKIPFLLLPFEVRILDIIPILLVLPFLGLFPSMKGVESVEMT